MRSNLELDKNNIIMAFEEGLGEEDSQRLLVALAYLKSKFLMGYKKDYQGTITRVQDFLMLAFKMNDNKVEIISKQMTPNPSSLNDKVTAPSRL